VALLRATLGVGKAEATRSSSLADVISAAEFIVVFTLENARYKKINKKRCHSRVSTKERQSGGTK